MCCTATDLFCTELDVCCDPCERNDIFVEDISGIPTGQTLTFGSSDDGDWSFVQGGGGPDESGPTLSVITFNAGMISDGETSNAYLNFDFLNDVCEGAIITEARLLLYADTNTGGHSSSITDNNCIVIQRVDASWDETTLAASNLPSLSTANTTPINSPTFAYENYDVDVTTCLLYTSPSPRD